jgi:hypothetical protein
MQRRIRFEPGQLELSLRRDRRVHPRDDTDWRIELQVHTHPSRLECTIRAALHRRNPAASFYAEGHFTLASADELGARIASLETPATDTQVGRGKTPEVIPGGGPVERYLLFPEADERGSPRIDIVFRPLELTLEPDATGG